jgi:hypothetical protein
VATLAEMRDAIQGFIEQIDGLSAYDTWPSSIKPPACLVRPMGIEYNESFNGNNTYTFEVLVVVRMANLRAAQDELDLYLSPAGPRSIRTVLDAGPSLGGAVGTVNVLRMHSYGTIEISGAEYFGAVIDCEVLD